jgi:dihydrodipicolinate synthase/N-acetylneuraminate lyase
MPASLSLHGLVVPMVSPFTSDGRIDKPAVERLVAHLIKGGVHGIFALGTTGESASIHPTEKRRLVEFTVRAADKKATVYAGIAANCFQESLEAAKAYAQIGADVLVAHVPSYFPLSNEQIESYFVRLADDLPLPLVLYNIPSTTHQTIPLTAIDRLRRHENIVALKESAGDPTRVVDLLRLTGGRDGFPILIGNSPQFLLGLKRGGAGIVPSGANLAPDLYRAMFDAAREERWDAVEELQSQTDALCSRYLKSRTLGLGLASLKAMLEERGLCGRTMLPPLTNHNGDGPGSVSSLNAHGAAVGNSNSADALQTNPPKQRPLK